MANFNSIINVALKVIIIALLIFAIGKQAMIMKLVYDRTDKLDADPLAYGAARYGIDECSCLVNNKTITFTPAGSKWIIHYQPVARINYSINYTEVLNGTRGDN